MPGDPSAVPVYRYDPNVGDRRATYSPVDFRRTHRHRPEIQARFVARVEGETFSRTLGGRHAFAWRAEPGTPCLILGYWSDGTVHVRWPGIRQHYRVDARLPAWVVAEEEDPAAVLDPHTLPANRPAVRRPTLITARFVVIVVTLLVILVCVGLVRIR